MFTTNHFIWLAICVVFIAALTFFSLKFKFNFKTATWIVVGISIASETCKIFTHITETESGGGINAFRSAISSLFNPHFSVLICPSRKK